MIIFLNRFASKTTKRYTTVQMIESVAHQETRIADVVQKVVLFVKAHTVILV